MSRQVTDAPQELFLTCGMNTLIASLSGLKLMTRQAQSNNNPFASSNDINQKFAPLINLHNAPSSIKHTCPPPRIQATIEKVGEHWIVNAHDDTLHVTNPDCLNRKTWMK